MTKYKKQLSILLCFCLIVSSLSGCSFNSGKDGTPDDDKKEVSTLKQAFVKLQDEKYKKAAKLFKEVLSDDDENIDAIVGLSESYIGLEEYEDAEELLRDALDNDEKDKELWDALIAVYKAADRDADALAELMQEAYRATGSERYNKGQVVAAGDDQSDGQDDKEQDDEKDDDQANNKDGVVTVVLSQDNLVAEDKELGVSVKFSDFDIETETNFTMEAVQTSLSETEMGDDVKATAYNFEYDGEELFDITEITLPFDKSFIDAGADIVNSVAAAYYNEDTESYEPVMYEVNADAGTVKIYAEHFSKYEVFTFKNPKTRRTKAILNEVGVMVNLSNMRDREYDAVFNEFMANEGKPGNLALEHGIAFGNDFLSFGGNTFTLLTETVLPASKGFENLTKVMTELGLVAAIYQATVDYEKGDTVALESNATKNITYYAVSKWGTRVAKLASVGVFAIDYSLNKFGTVAWQDREEMYAKAHKLYYEKKLQALGQNEKDYFRKKLWWAYQDNLKNEGDRKVFKTIVDEIIDDYVNEFWQNETDVAVYFSDANNGASFTAGGGLSDAMKERISNNAKYDLVKSLQPVFDVLNRRIKYASFNDLMDKMREVEDVLNSVYTVEISESQTDQNEPLKYKKAACIFAPLADGVEDKNWGVRLDDNAQGEIKFRLIGYMQSGMPDEIKVFKAGADYKTDKPDMVVDFKLTNSPIKVELAQNAPTLDQLVGVWDDSSKNSFTFVDMDVPWDTIKATIESQLEAQATAAEDEETVPGCDLLLSPEDVDKFRAEAESKLGQAAPMTFEIIKTGETTGELKFLSFPGNDGPEQDCEKMVDQSLKFNYVDGRLEIFGDQEQRVNMEIPDEMQEEITSNLKASILSETADSIVVAINGTVTSKERYSDETININMSMTLGLKGERTVPK